mmetsp:Transcript_21871/g.62090  ORF Transcript_21871/g.62090 Transcript_21871/m.62090 type:complete len:508 (+) Transcript_21871:1061-2584(+)
MREPLHHRAVDDGVQQRPGLIVAGSLLDHLVANLGARVAHHCLDHAAQGDARGQDATGAHLAPGFPDALNVPDEPVRADDAAEGGRPLDGHTLGGAARLQLAPQELHLVGADARLAGRAEQHFVHLALLQGLQQAGNALDIGSTAALRHSLEQDGAGDRVGLQPALEHLVDDGPWEPSRAPHGGVQKLVVGHNVGLQAHGPHLGQGGAGLRHAAVVEVRLDDRVGGNDVGDPSLKGLRRQTLCGLHVLDPHECVDHRVVQATRLHGARLKDAEHFLQPAIAAQPLQNHHAGGGVDFQALRAGLLEPTQHFSAGGGSPHERRVPRGRDLRAGAAAQLHGGFESGFVALARAFHENHLEGPRVERPVGVELLEQQRDRALRDRPHRELLERAGDREGYQIARASANFRDSRKVAHSVLQVRRGERCLQHGLHLRRSAAGRISILACPGRGLGLLEMLALARLGLRGLLLEEEHVGQDSGNENCDLDLSAHEGLGNCLEDCGRHDSFFTM